jgi:hypothetical protein
MISNTGKKTVHVVFSDNKCSKKTTLHAPNEKTVKKEALLK